MTKKSVDATVSLPEWNEGLKEPWHIDFDKEPVNDDKWSCVVTAAVHAEAQDEKCIQTYAQWVDTGVKKDVKIIHMSDVLNLIKEAGKQEKSEKKVKNVKPSDSPVPQIVELAAKYAVISETECTLPPDLTAALVKHMILNLKRENCLAKRIAAVREKKIRKRNIKAKFIRSLQPYKAIQQERKSSEIGNANTLEQMTSTENEFVIGPDLYILLIDFYKVNVFPELLKINVPFLAILKISEVGALNFKNKPSISSTKSEGLRRKINFGVNLVWETLKEMDDLDCQIFKDIPVLEYTCKKEESTLTKYIYDELTWIQYSAYYIFRQYRNYLKELKVQRLVQSLETLDLSKCEVYNKLCDALITGEPLTPLLVLYAIIEQVVAGVPETDSMVLEYEPDSTDFFPTGSDSFMTANDSTDSKSNVATSCMCAQKHYEKVCEELKRNLSNHSLSENNKGFDPSEYNSGSAQSLQTENSFKKLNSPFRTEFVISKTLIDEVMKEKKTEKEMRNEKRWKTPSLCFYGDFVFLQTYYCDTRILDPKVVMKRFLEKLPLPQIWKNHPKLLPEEKAYFNFHFLNFLKNSEECEEKLKIKTFFMGLSLQLISIKKSNWFIGEQDVSSEILPESFQEKKKVRITLSYTNEKSDEEDEEEEQKFQDFFVNTFIRKTNSSNKKTHSHEKDKSNTASSIKRAKPYFYINSETLHKTKSEFKIFAGGAKGRKRSTAKNPNKPDSPEQIQKFQNVPHSLMDCSEISNLIKHNFFLKKTDLNLIKEYKFYEKLTPRVMIQTLIEAEKNFNTVQYSHFPLIDTLLIIMYNDSDDKGVSFFNKQGILPTPVGFRDFYNHVYSQIKNWVNAENKHFLKFLSEEKVKKKEEEERRDAKYLTKLKKKYREMCEEKKKEFLETDVDVRREPEVLESELGDLPVKPKHPNFNKISFVVTNFSDLRVETNQKSYEFYSSDGTKIRTAVETWLYSTKKLHRLFIKKSKLVLYYNRWLNEKSTNLSFTLKTFSNIIFSFYKDDSQKMENFNLTISWPTGLLIKPIFNNSSTYVKQSYLKIYRKGWDIEEERSRCFVKNGQVLIFRENGYYDVLCGSGTKYVFKGSETKYEIVSTTGEIWEVRNNNWCRNKKELLGCQKVFVGVDPKTQETFCRREDGVSVMLWQNGTLVTNYPDGTKITSTPYFEEREEIIEWTEEEKLHFENLYKSEILVQDPRSRTILRNGSLPKYTEKKNSSIEGFITVECDYVMEHPKYSTVNFSKDPYIMLRMPEQLCVSIHQSGRYGIQQEKNFLQVNGDVVRFYTVCDDCGDQSSVTLNTNSDGTLCKCVDFFKRGFFVFRNGKIMFKEFYNEESEVRKLNNCGDGHYQKMASMQRCFILYRDLNGIEFIHADTFKDYCCSLPEETYFDIDTDDPLNISYTFSSPNYKIGPEKWVMDYENAENSLPTSIKKKDLKELGAKETSAKLFKYPFRGHCVDSQQHEKSKCVINMPKLIIGRTIRLLSDEPSSVIKQMQCYVEKYQKSAEDLYRKYELRKNVDESTQDHCNVEMRLRKIAFTLNQNFQMYPHLGIQFPSTEKEIHHFGHFINSMEGMKDHLQDDSNILPDCKQIPKPLPVFSDLPDIFEEPEAN